MADELKLSGIPWAFASEADAHELQDRFPEFPVIAKRGVNETVAKVLEGLLHPR